MIAKQRLARPLFLFLLLLLSAGLALAQDEASGEADEHAGHDHGRVPAASPRANFLSDEARQELASLIIQDYQGRMKPLDTLSREMVRKISKRSNFEGWEPLDLYLNWIVNSRYWFQEPLIAVRNPQLKERLGVSADTRHVSAASLLDESGQYRLTEDVETALRTADRDRSKFQRKLLSFDERVNLFFMNLRQVTLRIYPIPEDPNHTWVNIENAIERVGGEVGDRYREANNQLLLGLRDGQDAAILAAAREHHSLQEQYGATVLISSGALRAEMMLNRLDPFKRVIMPYLLAFFLLLAAFIFSLTRPLGYRFSFKQPLYLIGSLLFWFALLFHLFAFVMRWVASGRAPLSNGYESLIWISLMVAVAGFLFEFKGRRGLIASLAALLTAVVLGVSLLSTFDPAIGPLVPVLASYWLNIHVTIITSSYGFLGLSALIALAILVLTLFKGTGRRQIHESILELHGLHWWVLVTGLGLLSVGTLLGGVWANESWGRYWGWDSKETWSLITILVYATVTHLRFLPGLNRPWPMAAASLVAICSVVMTYFGVNYFLAGLHSYAAGDAATVPSWIYLALGIMALLILSSWWRDRSRDWQPPGGGGESPQAL